jgi:diguanylate cyclase (GGDEF)-like protein/PAS domain S-box-containing protein
MAHPQADPLTFALLLALLALALSIAGTRADLAWRRRRADAAAAAAKQWAWQLAEVTFDGIVIHRAGTVLQMNHACARLLGVREREWRGQNLATAATPEHAASLRAALEAPPPGILPFTLLRADKTAIPVELANHTIQLDGAPATATVIRDITQRDADAAQIARLLNFDALTSLPNRKSFLEALASAIAVNEKQGGTSSVFQIDIDQFKAINEQIGRTGGDVLLKQIAGRLGGLLKAGDMLARLGGDKFGILIPSTGAASRAILLAGQLEAAFTEPFIIDGQLVKASVSTGIAVFPDHAADPDGLMKASSFALKQAGRAGGGFCHMFSHDEAQSFRAGIKRDMFSAGITDPQRLTQDLRDALQNGEITLAYQPIFRAGDLAPAGFEALVRWTHRRDGPIPPNVFLPLAEQSGLIHEIGGYVLETACAEATHIAGNLKMAVNLSPLQFRDATLPARLTTILRKTGLPAARLELEVTERLLIDNAAAAAAALAALRAVGVSLTLDDFGTGISSLSYLCDFPFARLKIDKRFIAALGQDDNADAIVSAILALAANLRLEVTAEGVETDAQLAHLRKNGCHFVQGFLLGRPTERAVAPNIAPFRPALQRGQPMPASPLIMPATA